MDKYKWRHENCPYCIKGVVIKEPFNEARAAEYLDSIGATPAICASYEAFIHFAPLRANSRGDNIDFIDVEKQPCLIVIAMIK